MEPGWSWVRRTGMGWWWTSPCRRVVAGRGERDDAGVTVAVGSCRAGVVAVAGLTAGVRVVSGGCGRSSAAPAAGGPGVAGTAQASTSQPTLSGVATPTALAVRRPTPPTAADRAAARRDAVSNQAIDLVEEALLPIQQHAPPGTGYCYGRTDLARRRLDLWWVGPQPAALRRLAADPGGGVTLVVHRGTRTESRGRRRRRPGLHPLGGQGQHRPPRLLDHLRRVQPGHRPDRRRCPDPGPTTRTNRDRRPRPRPRRRDPDRHRHRAATQNPRRNHRSAHPLTDPAATAPTERVPRPPTPAPKVGSATWPAELQHGGGVPCSTKPERWPCRRNPMRRRRVALVLPRSPRPAGAGKGPVPPPSRAPKRCRPVKHNRLDITTRPDRHPRRRRAGTVPAPAGLAGSTTGRVPSMAGS